MADYDEFEDDDDVMMPRREYTDIEHQDSSFELRNRMRAGWASGEHLWDVDFNNNLRFLNWWNPIDVYNARLPKAPWINNPIGQRFLVRSGTYQDLIAHTGPASATYFVPFAGAKFYSKADRIVYGYSGSAWKPMFRHPRYPIEVEIAMFASYPRAGEICARHILSEKLVLLRDGGANLSRYSRFRSNRDGNECDILKNGVKIGEAQYSTTSTIRGNVSLLAAETEFDIGDEIAMRAPNPLAGVTFLSLSLLGKVIQE